MAKAKINLEGKEIIGLTEKVIVFHPKNVFKSKVVVARIDTGATSSSIDAKLAAELQLGPVVKTTVIKSTHGTTLRPVIYLNLKIRDRKIRARFNIADRSKMKYRILIGQNILKKGDFLIDPKK